MKRADMETSVGDKGRRGARVTEERLRETSASLCRDKAKLFNFSLETLCHLAEADRADQPVRQIIGKMYKKTEIGRKGPLLSGKGGNPNDSNHCFLIIAPGPTPATLIEHILSPAFVIKDAVVTILMYLRAEIIFAFGKLHPSAGKLQPSLLGESTSMMVMPFSLFKTKGNRCFNVCECAGGLQIKILSLF